MYYCNANSKNNITIYGILTFDSVSREFDNFPYVMYGSQICFIHLCYNFILVFKLSTTALIDLLVCSDRYHV